MGWKTIKDPEDKNWDVWWTDSAVQPEHLAKMNPYQKINHFPGMFALSRKNHLARNFLTQYGPYSIYIYQYMYSKAELRPYSIHTCKHTHAM